MHKYFLLTLLFFITFSLEAKHSNTEIDNVEVSFESVENNTAISSDKGDESHATVPQWVIIPFALLLLMIAIGPLFYEHFWHKNIP